MTWLFKEPGHQQPWYWPCSLGISTSRLTESAGAIKSSFASALCRSQPISCCEWGSWRRHPMAELTVLLICFAEKMSVKLWNSYDYTIPVPCQITAVHVNISACDLRFNYCSASEKVINDIQFLVLYKPCKYKYKTERVAKTWPHDRVPGQ